MHIPNTGVFRGSCYQVSYNGSGVWSDVRTNHNFDAWDGASKISFRAHIPQTCV